MSDRCPDCGLHECACDEHAERALRLSRLMFGWILDGIHGNDPPIFTDKRPA